MISVLKTQLIDFIAIIARKYMHRYCTKKQLMKRLIYFWSLVAVMLYSN